MFIGIVQASAEGCAAENGLHELILAKWFGEVVLLIESELVCHSFERDGMG
jgi:hypothetical protein